MTVNPEPARPDDAAPVAPPLAAAAAGRRLRRAGAASLLCAGPLAAVAALMTAPLALALPDAGSAHATQPNGGDPDQCNAAVAAAEAMAMKWPDCAGD